MASIIIEFQRSHDHELNRQRVNASTADADGTVSPDRRGSRWMLPEAYIRRALLSHPIPITSHSLFDLPLQSWIQAAVSISLQLRACHMEGVDLREMWVLHFPIRILSSPLPHRAIQRMHASVVFHG
jgi:hypothetical protein